jgi:hypothetical protein
MHNNDNKPDSHIAYGAAMDGVSAVVSSVSVVGRYWWNVQMQLLQKTGIMPVFRTHWWLFLVVGFLLLAFLPPIGAAFVISAFCAGVMDPKSKNDFIVPLRRDDVDANYADEVDHARRPSSNMEGNGLNAQTPVNGNPEGDSSAQIDPLDHLMDVAAIHHMGYLRAINRDLDDKEFAAAALGAFDGTVQASRLKFSDLDMHVHGASFVSSQLASLGRMDTQSVDPEWLAEVTTDAMCSNDLEGIRTEASRMAYTAESAMQFGPSRRNI